ncbi:MAG: helix-turn-helix transcriptional regulator [Ruminococcus sp.]|nr:helix-turn-helix transcriptional regulator [Ruminococcus sp.]
MSFSDKIRLLRSQNHLSQEELAVKMEVSRQTISKWESGITYPEIDKLIAISNLFHVSTDYLLKEPDQDQRDDQVNRLVLKFLGAAQDMDSISRELVDIMRDGIIDNGEMIKMKSIIQTLNTISNIIEEMKTKFGID